VVNGGQRFDVRVDATTGTVTRVDADRDRANGNQPGDDRDGAKDDRDGHGQDDQPGDDRGGS
jgi:hypothetical protein